ncbi:MULTISPECIES: SMP-30/gluconolactonase/LRE family protein [unclassified Streptomyces]|uniref:SMP-30/gluconolactonase/LRE family protein n=1 Tax=unclassified Streptomyces TaxID=2593676 RepID=UPI002DD7A21E|nr:MULTISPECIES: SMP-30/gluconolactonase/LRE family protein [unclassified Streptomyces]WSA95931.1 SMP-30/gluconolactonase/LRE family protein [Streptomyces sp. NBC_01795]WSB80346.1 SMP-30/gluconolactonase/LRE family protein [Streptomyces sp. NBC_01775]WSS11443.1 SMP-30/gluconolactonase/LRE family protein [Streptomyces sp. NBC_01186]WSS40157.1 SMP-30/gluconolactonase/LRE family protein [Streptomyces sp. NBC_01187]
MRRARAETAVRADATLGEGPTWDSAGERLIWVDILGSRVHTFAPASGWRTVMTTEQHVGAAKPRAGGGLVVNLRDGVGLYGPGGGFGWLRHDPVPGRRGNDAAIAPDGTLWAGTMRYDEAPGGGTLARLSADGTAHTVLESVAVSNGTGWSPDGRRLYYIDSPTRRIDVFDVREDGLVANRRPLAEIEEGAGLPDGLTVDAYGCVWVALWDGAAVRRYTPSGALDRIVELPVRRPTACAFGGTGLGDLYVTTARAGLAAPSPQDGSLLVLPGAGQGLPQPAFAG